MGMNNSSLAYKQVQPEQHLHIVETPQLVNRENIRRAKVMKMVMAASFVFVAFLSLAVVSAGNYSLGVELNGIKAQIAETQTLTARAELELGGLSALDRIEAYAIANLGMVYPATNDVYFLGEESSRAIAAAVSGQTEIAVAESAVEQSGWDKFISAITGFFRGEAYAAE